jgi:hypothetical protein
MIVGDLDTQVAAEQLRLLFEIQNIFARRGRQVSSFEDETRLLFDPHRSHEEVYQAMSSLTFRRVVARVANAGKLVSAEEIVQDLSGGIQEDKIRECLQRAIDIGLLVKNEAERLTSSKAGGDFGATPSILSGVFAFVYRSITCSG